MSKPRFNDHPQPQTAHDGNPHPERTCVGCCWWHKGFTDGPTGHCKRYAPTTAGQKDLPLTFADDWCGDWSESEQLRLVMGGRAGGRVWYWINGTQRSQEFESRGAAHEAEGLGTLEWRPMD